MSMGRLMSALHGPSGALAGAAGVLGLWCARRCLGELRATLSGVSLGQIPTWQLLGRATKGGSGWARPQSPVPSGLWLEGTRTSGSHGAVGPVEPPCLASHPSSARR